MKFHSHHEISINQINMVLKSRLSSPLGGADEMKSHGPRKDERLKITSVFKLRFIIIRLCFILFMLEEKNKQFDDILNICIFLRYSKIFQLEPFHGIHGN